MYLKIECNSSSEYIRWVHATISILSCLQTAPYIPGGQEAKHAEWALLGIMGNPHFVYDRHCAGSCGGLESDCCGLEHISFLSMNQGMQLPQE